MSEVTIVMTTWIPEGEQGQERLKAEEICLESWREFLIHDKAIHLHIADDGSSPEDFAQILSMAKEIWSYGEISWSQQQRKGVGASLNEGLQKAWERSDIVFHAVDDWQLLNDLNLTPWVNFMQDPRYKPGVVRFFPHPDLTGTVCHTPYGWIIDVDAHHYAFATRPSLWHKSFFNRHGYFKGDCSALECEADFNKRVCEYWRYNEHGSDIWLALPELWRPRETGSLSDLVPS